jgi:sugar lactone lactonase YvrE
LSAISNIILFTDASYRTINIIAPDDNYKSWKVFHRHNKNSLPVAIDFDPVEKRLYWTDTLARYIASAFFVSSSFKILYQQDVVRPEGLAIDYTGRNLYWTDAGAKRIEVGKLDGSDRKILIKDDLDEPRGITLHAEKG